MSYDKALKFKPQRNSAHPDDIAVDNFAAAMKQKLAAARAKGRGGWQQASAEELSSLLVAHLDKGNAGTFEDVANFAMMLHQNKADPAVLASMFNSALTAVARGFNAVEGESKGYPLVQHLIRQIAFSKKAFGPGRRTGGILEHIKKELVEVAAEPHDISEWIDIVNLALDGAWRHMSHDGLSDEEVAKEVVSVLRMKLVKNEKRDWPDWRLFDENKAIEHKRTSEESKGGAA